MKRLVIAMMILLIAACASAQTPKPTSTDKSASQPKAPQEKLISIMTPTSDDPRWQGRLLEQVLVDLFQQAGRSFVIDPGINANEIHVRLWVENAPFSQVLDTVLTSSGLGYRNDNGVYFIFRKPSDNKHLRLITLPYDVGTNYTSEGAPRWGRNSEYGWEPNILDQLFVQAGESYVLDTKLPALSPNTGYGSAFGGGPSNQKRPVVLEMKDVPFAQALDAVMNALDAQAVKKNGIYHISNKAQEASMEGIVNTCLESMPIQDAVAKVDPGWVFKGNLGKLTMPGARFYRFPKDMAIKLMIASAGLIPPDGNTKVVSAKGKADLTSFLSCHFRSQSTYGQEWDEFFDSHRNTPAEYGISALGEMSVAAYKPHGGKDWRFVVFADWCVGLDVARQVLALSATRFSERGNGQIPRFILTTIQNPKSPTGLSEVKTLMFEPAPQLTVQLSDMTLDQVLDQVLTRDGILYRKDGTPGNPAYTIGIEPDLQGYEAPPAPVIQSPAANTNTPPVPAAPPQTPAPDKPAASNDSPKMSTQSSGTTGPAVQPSRTAERPSASAQATAPAVPQSAAVGNHW